MSLASQVNAFAGRVGTEIKNLRSTLVPITQRGPIGGIADSGNVAGNINLDPALTNHRRLTLTGDTNISLMAAGTDGQRMLIEALASAGQRTLSFDPGYEISRAVPTRTFTIPSGSWGYVQLIYRNTAWRLVSAEPQATLDTATPSAWVPADHGLLAWTLDPGGVDFTLNLGSGYLGGSVIKVSTTDTCTAVSYNINTAGAGFTASRNYMGLYDPSGTLVAQTAEMTSTWSVAGQKTTPWTSSVSISPGFYYVGFICQATTLPVFAAATSGYALTGRGRSALGWRGSYINTTYTALPNTRPTPNNTINVVWFGLA